MKFKNIIKQKSRCYSSTPAMSTPRASLSPSLAIPGRAPLLVQGDVAQKRRAPMLPTSLCSFTKISKYW